MIFMDKETGELFELLVNSLDQELPFGSTNGLCYSVIDTAIRTQDDSKITDKKMSEFAESYDFIGFL